MEIVRIYEKNNLYSILNHSNLTALSNFLLSFPDISAEEFRTALFVSAYLEPTGKRHEIYDRKIIDEFDKNYKVFIECLDEQNMEDTVNKTLLKIKPLPPGSSPTVNTREACVFIDQLIHKPAFDSSDESEGISYC
ncbi:hypothetical protein RF11_02290 [Thelohanellus kitauei]|uniref:Uncharacterized protein n=1 Tax=Thelohanellus kitauei TaxID=669202 RepID=A0A0C2MRK0_THEKT|nr:hypothetical protein RF11_02290 [Thelohanellus kitauei]